MKRIPRIINHTHTKILEYNAKYGLGMGFWIFLILTFIFGILFFTHIELFIELIVNDYGYVGIFILAILLELLLQPIGPDVPLILGILGGLNPLIVLIAILAGAYIALVIAYIVGFKIGAPGIEYVMGTKKYKNISKHEQGGKWFLLIGALTPVPYIPYFIGVWKLSLKDIMLYVAIPRTVRFLVVFILTYYLGIILFN
ncbi:MAG: VTT domain-containing protein [Candidatus Woesearchaeota archaeon]